MVTETPEFKKATEESGKLKSKPTDDELLELYALFKQGKQPGTFEKAEKPGMFDLKGKAKYNAWKKVADQGMTGEAAQQKYVELVGKLKGVYGMQP